MGLKTVLERSKPVQTNILTILDNLQEEPTKLLQTQHDLVSSKILGCVVPHLIGDIRIQEDGFDVFLIGG